MKLLLNTEMDREHQAEMNELIATLTQKYGTGAVMAGTHLHNLMGLVRAMLKEVPQGPKRKELEHFAKTIINDVMTYIGDSLGVMPPQVDPVCKALDEYGDIMAGEHAEFVAEKAGAANEAIAKARA